MNLQKISYQWKVNITGLLSCVMAVTGISVDEFMDNGNRKLSGQSQKFIVSVEKLTAKYKDVRLYLCL